MTTAADIADKIATEQNLTKAQAKTIVDSVFRQIAETAKAGAETNVPEIGRASCRERV